MSSDEQTEPDDPTGELIGILQKISSDWVDNGNGIEMLIGIVECWKALILELFLSVPDEEAEDG